MSLWIGVLAAMLLIIANKYWAPAATRKLAFHGSCSHILAEPEETVVWSGTVENRSVLPIPFVRLREIFPDVSTPKAGEDWCRTHCQQGVYRWSVEERMVLGPRQCCTRTVELAFRKRGAYALGSYLLSAGDLLGISEADMKGEGETIVIMPSRARDPGALKAVGGFVGDISVRRFIMEDPILTVGFRDYTGREPMKAISWTRSASTGALQVRQFDHTAEQTVMILLNVERGSPEQLENCFSLTRMACEQMERQKIPYGLRTNGNLPGPVGKLFFVSEGLGDSHLNPILYSLGRADYSCFYSLRYLVTETLQRRKNNESYIVITPTLGAQEQSILRMLETSAGNPVCILSGAGEVDRDG